MARCGDGKFLFCVLFLSCCIATLAQRPMDCCHDVSRTIIKKDSVVDYRRQVKGQGCPIDAVIFVTRHGRNICFATDSPGLSDVMRHVDDLKKFCKENNYPHKRDSTLRLMPRYSRFRWMEKAEPRRCFGVKTENDPEPTAFHNSAMTTPPTLTTLAQGPLECCTDVSRTIIKKDSVVDYRRQVKGQGCGIDAVIFVTRHGKELCVATDSPRLSDVMKHVDDLKKGCKEGRYNSRHCFGVKTENDPEPTAFHSPAMTTPPTLTTLAQGHMDCCTDVSRITIERPSVVDYCRQFQGQHGCSIDAVILVTRHGRNICVATDLPWLSDVMRRWARKSRWRLWKKRHEPKRCFGVNSV